MNHHAAARIGLGHEGGVDQGLWHRDAAHADGTAKAREVQDYPRGVAGGKGLGQGCQFLGKVNAHLLGIAAALGSDGHYRVFRKG